MNDFTLGEHAASIRTLTVEMRELRKDVAEIRDIVSSARGGWKVASTIGALVGAVVAFVINLVVNGKH